MIKNMKQYVREYVKCQQERNYYKKDIEHEIECSKEI